MDSSAAPQRAEIWAALVRNSLDLCKSSKPHPKGSLPSFIHYLLKTPFPSTTGQRAPCSEEAKSHGNFCGWSRTSVLPTQRSSHTELDENAVLMDRVQATQETWVFAPGGAAEAQQGPCSSPAVCRRPGAACASTTALSPSAAVPTRSCQPSHRRHRSCPPQTTGCHLHRLCPTAAPLTPAQRAPSPACRCSRLRSARACCAVWSVVAVTC